MRQKDREGMSGARTGGRPRNAVPSANVCARVPGETFELLRTSARDERVSISEYVRRVLVLNLPRRSG